jgi:hypothetical protein
MEYACATRVRDDLFDNPNSPAERSSRRPHTDPPPLEEEEDNSLKQYSLEGVTIFNIRVNKLFWDYKEEEFRNFLISYSHQCSLSVVLETLQGHLPQ